MFTNKHSIGPVMVSAFSGVGVGWDGNEVAQSCLTDQAPLSMGFSRQEYWSGLPFPSPEYLPDSGIEPRSPSL